MTDLPSRDAILEFVKDSSGPVGKREIAKAFGIKGDDRRALRALLGEMAEAGDLELGRGKTVHEAGGLPKVTVLRVVSVEDGRPFAIPESWDNPDPPPRVLVREKKGGRALGEGDRILARIEETGRGYRGHLMKRIGRTSEEVLGILRADERGHFLQPTDKRLRKTFSVHDIGEARPGDLVLAAVEGRKARVTQRLGDPFEPRSISLIAIHAKGLPHVFPEKVLEQADKSAGQPLGDGREDLRHLPILTIDPEDARDHDDALHVRRSNKGGWDAVIAIADVSHYVRPGSALDAEARKRGNSAYFPDRVVPMLPEVLSAGACSLVENEDRAALVCHLHIAEDGTLSNWRFARAVIRVAANIAYEQAADWPDIEPLWEAWRALFAARQAREPLELDIPERRVELDADGRVIRIGVRERLDAHRLVEDFMIAANVAAAKALEKKKSPVVYRAHETPGSEKIDALREYLKSLGVPFAKGQVIRPALFNRMLDALTDPILREQVSTEVLRSQTQAYYTTDNLGHFGLSLASYAHFTSPIRRYSDLLVHRALVRAFDLGPGALTDAEEAELEQISEHISKTERRAMEAERDTTDRYVAAYLSERAGDVVEARITGVTKHGLFATVDGVGGDGLLPMRALGGEYWQFDEATRTITGERSGTTYSIGQRLELRMVEANPVTGGLIFELPDGAGSPGAGGPRAQPRGRRKPGTSPKARKKSAGRKGAKGGKTPRRGRRER
ncbi:ribonuclease R [Pacificimonas flava]|uniref:Ribonuclease R n=2 Tax=Pacificimonas TaxID=1960290 RepID=A0A219B1U3_9SPHN|nr:MULTISPECIES: ribonuclease R [Pacificimonas]MBZ6378058.1 ribonuclease R [Pacificimonas aurantium]OWV32300.1 ribonuclease R [Pacificimonas flava]